MDDVTQANHIIRYYVNGNLVYTETKASKSTQSQTVLRVAMPSSSSGTLYIDNFYYGTVGGNEGRGEGTKVDEDITFDYTGTTATELNSAGKLVNTGSATIDGTGITATVDSANGDAALHLSHSSDASGSEGYFNIKSDVIGKNTYVFETDIMFTSATSSRSGSEFLQLMSSNASTGASSFWGGMPGMSLKATTVDGVKTYSVVVGETEVAVDAGEWFNIRYEFDDWKTTGNEIRVYVNDVLVHTATNTKTTTAFYFIRVFMPKNSTAEVYLDNTFFGAIV